MRAAFNGDSFIVGGHQLDDSTFMFQSSNFVLLAVEKDSKEIDGEWKSIRKRLKGATDEAVQTVVKGTFDEVQGPVDDQRRDVEIVEDDAASHEMKTLKGEQTANVTIGEVFLFSTISMELSYFFPSSNSEGIFSYCVVEEGNSTHTLSPQREKSHFFLLPELEVLKDNFQFFGGLSISCFPLSCKSTDGIFFVRLMRGSSLEGSEFWEECGWWFRYHRCDLLLSIQINHTYFPSQHAHLSTLRSSSSQSKAKQAHYLSHTIYSLLQHLRILVVVLRWHLLPRISGSGWSPACNYSCLLSASEFLRNRHGQTESCLPFFTNANKECILSETPFNCATVNQVCFCLTALLKRFGHLPLPLPNLLVVIIMELVI